jgi:hypothetical protein
VRDTNGTWWLITCALSTSSLPGLGDMGYAMGAMGYPQQYLWSWRLLHLAGMRVHWSITRSSDAIVSLCLVCWCCLGDLTLPSLFLVSVALVPSGVLDYWCCCLWLCFLLVSLTSCGSAWEYGTPKPWLILIYTIKIALQTVPCAVKCHRIFQTAKSKGYWPCWAEVWVESVWIAGHWTDTWQRKSL